MNLGKIAGMRRASNTRPVAGSLMLVLAVSLLVASAVVAQPDEYKAAVAHVRALLEQAKDLDAKRNLSGEYRLLEADLKEAEKNGAGPAEIAGMEQRCRSLVAAADLLSGIRRHKDPLATLLGRYDQSLREVASLYKVILADTLTGPAAADVLLTELNRRVLSRTMLIDSLTVANRNLQINSRGTIAAQESTLTALQVEVSSLRQRLWNTELRAGVAEADRSAAESALSKRQEREAAILRIGETFTTGEGEVLLTPGGEIRIRIFGFAFAVGSAVLQTTRPELIDKLVAAVTVFPSAQLRIEGHTDDTGSREANLRLSRRRAETVGTLLQEKLGLSAERLQAIGLGPDYPIAPNSRAEGRARNRRIEVIIVPAG